ncbi:glycosyltransferase [Frankia sp. CNm7]|uniref:Glycosyltransferase n=1 Tax=Frankia nepalensis TaxID=1836974 RepID=A0A937RI49_9ACTN|nr:glycosyltransferase family 2 protein [Frankia nepalensis]MBL7495337.1 glycosyltransferase [Frankia nepalensis]MBL7513287.1 glycosyltransferase [Frankia nepalensis]MBL7524476.1 glycosyltransferase [Frankia nepalensis]MBL7627774.1 glycosyltransferase [Frankia nepalensis]
MQWLSAAVDFISSHRSLIPIGIAGVVSWVVWLTRRLLSTRYRPVRNNFRTTTSVIVPSFREDPDVLERCLKTWLAQEPTEIIIVPDVEDTELIERLARRADPTVTVIPFVHEGKRSALGVGISAARYDVIVLCDSDTAWEPGLLAAVQMPFVDPEVGGVGTRQNVYEPRTSVWRRVANWLVDIRYLDYVPAQGRAGAVACLSGRTAAYRRSAVLPVLHNLEHEFFLGRRCIAGDDGRLTWLVLASGYKTVHQDTARAMSMFPDSLRAFIKQRVRWSRNSYRTYLTAIYKGWLWRQPLITQVGVLQIVLTPVTMGIAMTYFALWMMRPEANAPIIAIVWLLLGRAIRGMSHLKEHPRDIFVLPLTVLMIIVVALPIKAWALVSMNKQGWLTRRADLIGGEGQSDASTRTSGPSAPAPAGAR